MIKLLKFSCHGQKNDLMEAFLIILRGKRMFYRNGIHSNLTEYQLKRYSQKQETLDGTVNLTEFLYELPYIPNGLLAWRMRSKAALLVVAIAWLSHGFYDFYHDILFINPGVFSWYPAFCAIVDVTVAGYLLLSYKKLTMQPA